MPSPFDQRTTNSAIASFVIFPDASGCWRARKSDGLVEGFFTSRDAAVRFARAEGRGIPGMRLIFTETAFDRSPSEKGEAR